MTTSYLMDVIVLLLAAVVAVPLFQAVKLGAVPGFLVAGVVVGPSGFRLIDNIKEIADLAEFGVILLLFVIGIELRPSRLWLMRRLVFGLGTLQVLLTGVALGAVSHFLFGVPVRAAILVGPALALSSTAFILQLLTEKKSLASSYGRTSLAVLLLQDLAVVPLLALVPLLAQTELSIGKDIGLALIQSLLILGLVVLFGRFLLHPVLHRVALSGNPEVFTASAVLIVLGTALVTEHIGLSMGMGAFLAGLLISDSFYRHQVMAEIQPFRGLLLGLFFMSMGMSLNLTLLFENPLLSIGMVSLLVIVKAGVLYLISYGFGIKDNNGLAVALLLAQSGEFALVLFSIALQSGIITSDLFQQLLLVVLLSMLATPALAHLAQRLVKLQSGGKAAVPDLSVEVPIVLAGFGRVGHRIGEILTMAGKPYVALDSDAAVVEKERAKGHPVYFGDVCKPELLKAAGASNARIIIVTLNEPSATEAVVSSLRRTYPDINIYARGRSMRQCRDLRRMGASGVVSETVEASLELARMALINMAVDEERRDVMLEEFRQKYRSQIDSEAAVKDTNN